MRRLLWTMAFSSIAILVFANAVNAQDHAYVGTKNCRKCHIKEYKSWSETKMAQAFETLKPGVASERKTELGLDPGKDYTTDQECVRCHVTGYGMTGGFTSIEETPDLAGVGCEMCHGPGGTYTQDGYMTLQNKEYKKADLMEVGLVNPPTEQQCLVCHNEENPIPDYTFDFEAKKGEGTHEVYPLRYSHE